MKRAVFVVIGLVLGIGSLAITACARRCDDEATGCTLPTFDDAELLPILDATVDAE